MQNFSICLKLSCYQLTKDSYKHFTLVQRNANQTPIVVTENIKRKQSKHSTTENHEIRKLKNSRGKNKDNNYNN